MNKYREDMATKKTARLIANMERARAVWLRATGRYDRRQYDGSHGAEDPLPGLIE